MNILTAKLSSNRLCGRCDGRNKNNFDDDKLRQSIYKIDYTRIKYCSNLYWGTDNPSGRTWASISSSSDNYSSVYKYEQTDELSA